MGRFRGKGDDHCSGFLAENEGESKKFFLSLFTVPQGEKVPVKTGSSIKWNISFLGRVVDGLWGRREEEEGKKLERRFKLRICHSEGSTA